MPDKISVNRSSMQAIADKIRSKGVSGTFTPSEMPNAIERIPTGIDPSGTLLISSNGDYNVRNYNAAWVRVPSPEGTTYISENGIYDVTNYQYADVRFLYYVVSASSGTIGMAGTRQECIDYIDMIHRTVKWEHGTVIAI